MTESINRIAAQDCQDIKQDLISNITNAKRAGGVASAVKAPD
jgi:hypothetical protein